MKASYNWLKDYCDFDLPAHELSKRLSAAGLNVDSFEPAGDDWVLDVEVTTNRPDCLCHMGLAREIAAITGGKGRRPQIELDESKGSAFEDLAAVEVPDLDLCPRYTARLIKGVKVGPSPQWLQQRLAVCGVRPINNVVDATNYVMLECGQPFHAFDFALIDGGKIIVRRSQAGETITTIDGTEIELSGEECIIADAFKPIALAGVMGGLESEISDSTADVLIESARFDPQNNRQTTRRHGLVSESSYRFERGIDPEITDWASRRVCQIILQLAGGQLAAGSADVRVDAVPGPEVTMRLSRLALILGHAVPAKRVTDIFAGLELDVLSANEDEITVRTPSWRADLGREIDLIEEVARLDGYEKVSETTQMTVRPVQPSPAEIAERRARRALAGAGFCEVMSYSLVAATALQLSQPWHDGQPIAVRNPVTVDKTHLRLTNMANLLHAKRLNQARGTPEVDLFELSRVYIPAAEGGQPDEKLCLTMLTDRQDGLRVLKGVLANLLGDLGVEAAPEELLGARGPFQADQSVTLRLEGQMLGCVGVAADQVADGLDLRNRPALMEIDFGLLSGMHRLHPPYRPVPVYPATDRDLAILVAEDVRWADIEKCVRASGSEMLESVEFFDVYRGEPVPKGHKSVAFSLTFRRNDGTITAAQAEEALEAVLVALRERLGARLRSTAS